MKQIILLLVLGITFSTLQAQNICDCTDFKKEDKDTFDKSFKSGDFATATTIANKLISYSDKCCKAKGAVLIANLLFEQKKYDSVLIELGIAKKYLGGQYDSMVSYELFRLKGAVSAERSQQDSAIYYYLEGLKLAEKNDFLKYQIAFCNDISYTFASIDQPEQSILYNKKSLDFALLKGDNENISMGYTNLVSSYGMLYEKTKNQKYIDSMSILAPLALKYANLSQNPFYIIKCYNLLGGIALEKQDFELAILYCDTVISMTDNPVFEQLKVSATYRKGQCLSALGKYKESVATLMEGLELTKKWGNDKVETLFYQQLYYTHRDNNNPGEALKYFEIYTAISDSLMNLEKTNIINDLEQKYNKEKNEQTITELNQEKEISSLKIKTLIIGIVAALMVALSIFLYYRQRYLKQERTILETEQRLNRARMNPHFFFNALTALQSFALKENDGKQLASNLSKFSHIMRETLESTYKDYVTIEQEVDFLREYLELQRLRFPNKFTYHLDLVKEFDTDDLMIPSMIIQPFVENSIEHGFAGIDYEGELKVLFDESDSDVIITIIDNGKGLHTGTKENSEHISRASQIIKDRIYLLNIKLKTKASFNINNNPDHSGVIVKIYLPKINKHESTHH